MLRAFEDRQTKAEVHRSLGTARCVGKDKKDRVFATPFGFDPLPSLALSNLQTTWSSHLCVSCLPVHLLPATREGRAGLLSS